MFIFKKIKNKKGYILLYTLMISGLCMIIIMLSFKLIMVQKENSYYLQKYVLSEKIDKKYKEHMLTDLAEFIKTRNIENVQSYFKLHNEEKIVSYEKSYIKYSMGSDSFILTYQYSEGVLRNDEYSYQVIDGLIKYTYRNTIYGNGWII